MCVYKMFVKIKMYGINSTNKFGNEKFIYSVHTCIIRYIMKNIEINIHYSIFVRITHRTVPIIN